jgi:hypothetical protein
MACVRSSNIGEHTGQQAWLRGMMLRAHDGARSDSKDNDEDKVVDERIFGLLITHCFAHVLALDCERALDDVTYLADHFEPMLLKLWSIFYHTPAKQSDLQRFLKDLKIKQLGIVKAVFARWLSHYRAVKNMRLCFTAMVRALQASVSRLDGKEKSDMQGVLHNITTFRFVATVHFFCMLCILSTSSALPFSPKCCRFLALNPAIWLRKPSSKLCWTISCLLKTHAQPFFNSLPT